MKLSIAIMTHPARAEFIPYLKEKLGDVPVSIDTGFGIWENYKRAWLMHNPQAEYHCVVQDDLIIGKDFRKNAEAVLNQDMIYNFYIGNRPKYQKALSAAIKNKTPFIAYRIYHECCIAMRVDRIPDMLAFCDALQPQNCRVLTDYVLARKLQVCFSLPSLVDHRDSPALSPFHRGSYKNGAKWFVGE